MPNGQASDCPPRLNGSLRRAADWRVSLSSGEMIFVRMESGWQTRIKATFLTKIAAKMAIVALRQWLSFPPMDMDFTTWRVTSGNGRVTGTVRITIRPCKQMVWPAIHRDRIPAYDPAEPGQAKKVHRGGSFLCTDQYCSRYIVGTRGKGDVDTGTNHLGFRCVMTLQQSQTAQNLNKTQPVTNP